MLSLSTSNFHPLEHKFEPGTITILLCLLITRVATSISRYVILKVISAQKLFLFKNIHKHYYKN